MTQGTLDNADLGRLLLLTVRSLARDDVLVVATTGGPDPGPLRPGFAGQHAAGALRPPRSPAPPRRRHGDQRRLRRGAAGAGQRRPPRRGGRQRGQARGGGARAVVGHRHQPAHRPALAGHGGPCRAPGSRPGLLSPSGAASSRPRSPRATRSGPSAGHWPSCARRTMRCGGAGAVEPFVIRNSGPDTGAGLEKAVPQRGGLVSAGCRPCPVTPRRPEVAVVNAERDESAMGNPTRSGRLRRLRVSKPAPLPDSFPDSGLLEDLPGRELHRGLFHLLFGRDPAENDPFGTQLERGTTSPRQLMEWLIHSAEWSHSAPMTEFGPSLHYGRGVFIRSLPKARRILDIGGVALGVPYGALVLMGYPYQFEEIVIVDLPSEDRHELYQDDQTAHVGRRPGRAGQLPLPLHDRPEQLPLRVFRHGLQRGEHRAHHAPRGRTGTGGGAAGAQAGRRSWPSTPPTPS